MNSLASVRSISSVLAAVVGIGPLVAAGQILVPSQYTDLQAAIDAALPGDVICIDGGVHGPVTIDKPLSLVGHLSNVPFLQCSPLPLAPPYEYTARPAITLEGQGTGAVTLAGLELGGEVVNWWFWNNPEAIEGGGFEELWIVNCEVNAPASFQTTSSSWGSVAVRVTVDDLIVSDSTIKGGTPTTIDGWFSDVWAGGHAIVSTGDVSVYDSTIEGGDAPADNNYWDFELDSHLGCSHFSGGQGGSAVSTPGTLYHGGATFLAGTPAQLTVPTQACSYFPVQTVPALSVGSTHTYNGAMLPPVNLFAENQTVTIQWIKSLPGAGLLLIGWPAVAPGNYFGYGEMYLDAVYWKKKYFGTGLKSETFPGLSYSGYKGVPMSFQVWSQAEGLSRPVIECWQPN